MPSQKPPRNQTQTRHFRSKAKDTTPTRRQYPKVGRVTAESVHKCTGRDWDQWIALLDKAGARGWTHQEIVAFLKKMHQLGLWWQQGVTLGYEIAIGRRIEGQSAKGDYSTVATRTFPIDQKAAWKLMTSEAGLEKWVRPLYPFKFKAGAVFETDDGVFGEIRSLQAPKRARLAWKEEEWRKPSVLNLIVVPRPGGKSVVVLQHDGLADGRLQARFRAHWKRVLDDILQGM